ncbi:emp24/gp25L/p24 family/GOLD-domain-containing protein [Chytriomyces sp. MP71]|nr:emp24/gp25L/p24 family/GOLD-domain-containing protein [Chytriomyces sp. MP71]
MTPFLSIVVALTSIVQASNNFHITVEPQSKHCFFEPMASGQKLGLSFQVFGGTNLDIDFWVTNPDELIVQSAFRTSTGSFVVDATKNGAYGYCISNMGHAGNVEKSVSFSVNGPDEQYKSAEKKAAGQKDQETVKGSLEAEIRELANTIQQVSDEQQYIRQRLLRHHMTAESTNSRVVYWTFFEGIMIAGVIGFQIFYITQFFNKTSRRMV